MSKLTQQDYGGYLSTQDGNVEESLDVSIQNFAQAMSQVQQAQKECIYQRMHEALHSQEQHVMSSLDAKVLTTIDEKLSNHFKEIMQSMVEKMQKLEESMVEKIQKLEESMWEKIQKLEKKVMDIDQRPQLIVGGKKYELGMREAVNQATNRLEDVESLANDTANALDLLCSRVECLEKKPCACTVPVTTSPLLASPVSDVPFVSSTIYSSSDGIVSPTTTTSVIFSSRCSVGRKPSLTPSLESLFRSENDVLLAVRRGNVQSAVQQLLGGAAVRLSEKEINELLHEAVKASQEKVVSLLLNAGADCNARNCNDETPLHVATLNNQPVIMSALLEAYCDVNARNSDGVTALHLATRVDASGQSVSLLLRKHADVSIKTARGDTPLHWAAVHSNIAAVQALLSAKASKKVRNNCGKIPWDLAETFFVRELLFPRGKCK